MIHSSLLCYLDSHIEPHLLHTRTYVHVRTYAHVCTYVHVASTVTDMLKYVDLYGCVCTTLSMCVYSYRCTLPLTRTLLTRCYEGQVLYKPDPPSQQRLIMCIRYACIHTYVHLHAQLRTCTFCICTTNLVG